MNTRIIKFRAWNKNKEGGNEGMYKVGVINFTNKIAHLVGYMGNAYFDFDELELMQFTGLLDKNGKEMYEGDIIKRCFDRHTCVYEMVFKHGQFGGMCVSVGHNSQHNVGNLDREIIGNVYENKDLLKDNDKT